jgi:hypothetical protein
MNQRMRQTQQSFRCAGSNQTKKIIIKMKKPIVIRLLALAGLAFAAQSVQAAPSPGYSNADLLVDFRATSGTGVNNDYVVDIGPASALNSSFSLNLGTDLANATNGFGSGWYTGTGTTVLWSVVGGDNGNNTLWASNTSNLATKRWLRDTDNNQLNVSSSIDSVGSGFNSGSSETNGSVANSAYQVVASTPSAYATYMTPPTGANTTTGHYFSEWATSRSSMESTLNNTAQTLFLDYLPDRTATNQPGASLGSFALDSTGNLTFSAVPEPSTWASLFLAIGSVVMLARMRRTSVKA